MISKQAIEELEISLPDIENQKAILEIAELSTREQTLLYKIAEKRERYISTILVKFAEGE